MLNNMTELYVLKTNLINVIVMRGNETYFTILFYLASIYMYVLLEIIILNCHLQFNS